MIEIINDSDLCNWKSRAPTVQSDSSCWAPHYGTATNAEFQMYICMCIFDNGTQHLLKLEAPQSQSPFELGAMRQVRRGNLILYRRCFSSYTKHVQMRLDWYCHKAMPSMAEFLPVRYASLPRGCWTRPGSAKPAKCCLVLVNARPCAIAPFHLTEFLERTTTP